jgi:CubicO group peptidase (beta-lactamase class C family)
MERTTFMDPLVVMPGRVAAYRLDGANQLSRDRRLEVDYGPLFNDLGATAVDLAHWLVAMGTDRPLAKASRETMWTPVALADGRPNDETWQWRNYGLGVGLDRVLGRRVVTHSGHSGVGFFYLPDERRGVVVLTNLEHASGSEPIGLAWGIAGRLWPALELSSTAAATDPDAAATAAARGEYERLLAGKPDLDRWALRNRAGGWDGAASLAGRSRRWGALRSFAFVRAEPGESGERLRFYRAEHEKGAVLVRFALDRDGRVVAVTWYRP